jgi:hypothetical protein
MRGSSGVVFARLASNESYYYSSSFVQPLMGDDKTKIANAQAMKCGIERAIARRSNSSMVIKINGACWDKYHLARMNYQHGCEKPIHVYRSFLPL